MTVQHNIISLGKSAQNLGGEVTIGLIHLMKIVNVMGCTGLDPSLLGLGVSRLDMRRSRDSTHNAGS
jgi:hypothetical protein